MRRGRLDLQECTSTEHVSLELFQPQCDASCDSKQVAFDAFVRLELNAQDGCYKASMLCVYYFLSSGTSQWPKGEAAREPGLKGSYCSEPERYTLSLLLVCIYFNTISMHIKV